MKVILNIVVVLFCLTSFGQEQKVTYEKKGNDLVKATYYYADNSTAIQKEGFFNKEGELHGTWTNYNAEGNKTVIATYNNGVKEGVWTFIKNNKVNLVTYNKNKIIKVEEKALVVN
jgi:antitoxin component YwqK of YwqJK toxin-antitoxin module